MSHESGHWGAVRADFEHSSVGLVWFGTGASRFFRIARFPSGCWASGR